MTREEWRDRAIEHGTELRKVKKQLEIAKDFIFRCANDISGDWYINSAKCVLKRIEELENEFVALDNQTRD